MQLKATPLPPGEEESRATLRVSLAHVRPSVSFGLRSYRRSESGESNRQGSRLDPSAKGRKVEIIRFSYAANRKMSRGSGKRSVTIPRRSGRVFTFLLAEQLNNRPDVELALPSTIPLSLAQVDTRHKSLKCL